MPSLRYVRILFNPGGKAELVFTGMGGWTWSGPSLQRKGIKLMFWLRVMARQREEVILLAKVLGADDVA